MTLSSSLQPSNPQPILQQCPLEKEIRRSGIQGFDSLPWGTHASLFYKTKQELLEILAPYFKAGLENNEQCVWIVSEPLRKEEALEALQKVCRDAESYIKKEQIIITAFDDWYRQLGKFNPQTILGKWAGNINMACLSHYEGLRVSGDVICRNEQEWEDFMAYEKELNHFTRGLRILVLCTYNASLFAYNETIDVFSRHEYILAKRGQNWRITESVEQARAKEIETNRKVQEQFIDNLCHELRNPLHGAFGNIDLMKGTLQTTDKVVFALLSEQKSSCLPQPLNVLQQQLSDLKEYTNSLDQCITYQKTLVDEVLCISKLRSQKVKLLDVEFDPNQVVSEACKLFQPAMQRKSLNLCCESKKQPIWVIGDAPRLKEVLINLLSNATKFTPEKGKISIRLGLVRQDRQSTELMFEVEDSGMGMAEEEVSRLFNRFEQLSSDIHTQREGAGLGLAISKSLVELMGGHIEVKSQKQKGTKFSFNVILRTGPFQQEKIAQPIAPKSPFRSTDIKVLVVEDNLINQKILVKQLEQKGYACFTANNGKEALDVFNQQPLDIILTDIQMPVMDGIELIRKIRGHSVGRDEYPLNPPTIPIICLSGYTSDQYIKNAAEAGMTAYITKPYEKIKLLQKIHECFQKRRTGQLNWSKVAMAVAYFRANRNNSALATKDLTHGENLQLILQHLDFAQPSQLRL